MQELKSKIIKIDDPKALAEWSAKRWIWAVDKKEGYLPAWILSENGDILEVEYEDGSVTYL